MKTNSYSLLAIPTLVAIFISFSARPLQAQETSAGDIAEAAVAAAEAAAAGASSAADMSKDSKSFRRDMAGKIKAAKDAVAKARAALKNLDNSTRKSDLNIRLAEAEILLGRVEEFVNGGYEGDSPQEEDKKKEKEKEKAEEAARKAAGSKPVHPIDPDKILEGLKGGSFLPGGGKPKDKDKGKGDGLGPVKIAWKDFVELLKKVKEKVDGAGGALDKGVKDFLDGKLKLPWFVLGTGETIGNVASLTVFNPLPVDVEITLPPTVLTSSSGNYQPYVLPRSTNFTVLAGQTKTLLLDGICADPRKPPSTVANSGDAVLLDSDAADFPQAFKDQIAGAQRLLDAVDRLQKNGSITTPFSGDPQKERETVIQQTFWIYTAARSGTPYNKEEFANKLYSQGGFQPPNTLTPPAQSTVAKAGEGPNTLPGAAVATPDSTIKPQPQGTVQPGTSPPTQPGGTGGTTGSKPLKQPTEAQKKILDTGVDQFWESFQLTGKEAKIID